jgi:hypothetical protein
MVLFEASFIVNGGGYLIGSMRFEFVFMPDTLLYQFKTRELIIYLMPLIF